MYMNNKKTSKHSEKIYIKKQSKKLSKRGESSEINKLKRKICSLERVVRPIRERETRRSQWEFLKSIKGTMSPGGWSQTRRMYDDLD